MKGEESAEAKIKSFDEVRTIFVLKSWQSGTSTSGIRITQTSDSDQGD